MCATHDSPDSHSLVIRDAEALDAIAIRNIALASGIDAWTVDQYREETGRSDAVILAALHGPDIVGFITGRLVPSAVEGYDGEIYNIAVLPEVRGKGIGRELLENAVAGFSSKGCNALWLEVRESNRPGIEFYENNGFTQITSRRNFYSNPVENAIVMRLTLLYSGASDASPNA